MASSRAFFQGHLATYGFVAPALGSGIQAARTFAVGLKSQAVFLTISPLNSELSNKALTCTPRIGSTVTDLTVILPASSAAGASVVGTGRVAVDTTDPLAIYYKSNSATACSASFLASIGFERLH